MGQAAQWDGRITIPGGWHWKWHWMLWFRWQSGPSLDLMPFEDFSNLYDPVKSRIHLTFSPHCWPLARSYKKSKIKENTYLSLIIPLSTEDSLNSLPFVSNRLFFLVHILEQTSSCFLFPVLESSRIFQAVQMSWVPLERFVTVQPRQPRVPEVLTPQQFSWNDFLPSSGMSGDQLVLPSGGWSAGKWRFAPGEMCTYPKVMLQDVFESQVSPGWTVRYGNGDL